MVRRIWTVLRSRAPFVRAVPKITSWSLVSLVAGLMLALAGCRGVPDVALTDLTEARRLMADLRIQFTKAADASNRAVMADTDEQSIAFAHEAEQATAAVGNDAAALAPRLHDLGYPPEVRLLEEFNKHFANYRTLDHDVLQLAVENTNLKAQRLSFGPVREAADAFRDALEPLGAKAKDHCRVESLAAKAVLAVRDIQVLQAPHIAEADDAAMARMEAEMHGLEVTAGEALDRISALVEPAAQPQLALASAALARFKDLSAQIVTLSRRNSNVRSLSLSLREKPVLIAACDDSLRSLADALAKEGFTATR
jgi:hypothetical protein